MKSLRYLIFVIALFPITLIGQVPTYDSGGRLIYEQAAYDVDRYDLDLQIFPNKQAIEGTVIIEADIVLPIHQFVFDLDRLLKVKAVHEIVEGEKIALSFKREKGKVWANLEKTRQAGDKLAIAISYGGKPRIAPNPPWDGGFQWEQTASGDHWIATSNQMVGPDVWWPVKDHVSDEPRIADLHIRVQDPLVVATNGKFVKKETHNDKTSTYHWHLNNPINAYNIALNIAPYRTIESVLNSVSGDKVPVYFYVLPEDYEKGQKLMPEIIQHLEFYEKYLGPYPFRSDKYGVAQTPHLGMEHQTIIAYGANFSNTSMTRGTDWGFDALHHHELGHEWWGNLVTNYDWRDMWLHEGFCSYMQPLYMEELKGKEGYLAYIKNMRRFANQRPIAPREITSAIDIYKAPIYSKGAWVLHTLRYLLGDEDFFKCLRLMAYPDPALEKVTDGSQTRFVTTEDFIEICEQVSSMELDWFFEVYTRQPKLPKLRSRISEGKLSLSWETPIPVDFPMPVEVEMNGEIIKFTIPKKGLEIDLSKDMKPVVDPNGWLLFDLP